MKRYNGARKKFPTLSLKLKLSAVFQSLLVWEGYTIRIQNESLNNCRRAEELRETTQLQMRFQYSRTHCSNEQAWLQKTHGFL